jgi:exportin-T
MISEDVTDPSSQKLAFNFLNRCITFWARMPSSADDETQNNGISTSSGIHGFERFIYEHVIPLAFKIPSLPNFNIQDGQMVTVSSGAFQTN